MVNPENMCQCFFYLDKEMEEEVASMTMPVPPVGGLLRIKMSRPDDWATFQILGQVTEFIRTEGIPSIRYRFIVKVV